MAMTPTLKISQYKELKVGARVSKSGQATAAKGDLFAETGPTKSGLVVKLIIDKIVQ
jgi:cytochrome c-type biogenesis protein CcmH